ncbi:MAG TPA: hypothetical protein VGS18_03205, partial [Thermoplasmata archaeon]|nr:hypothetical protein [Thermoplasmata archaeon]
SQTVPSLPCSPNASGNWTVKVVVTDAVGQTSSSTVAITVGAAGASGKPAISAFGAYPAAIVLGNSTNFTVSAAGGTKPLSYAYSSLPAGCGTANRTKLACTPISAGVFSVLVNVTDAAGAWSSVTTNLTVYPVGGGAGLTVSGFGASPGKFDLGSSTVLAVIASGGVGPIGYSYAGLPPGCTAANSSLLPCAPTSPGNYTVYATVFDSSTDRAGVRTVLEVLPTTVGAGPLVSRFLLSPANATVGTTVTIVATVAGGTLPLTFGYTGLPTGCTSQNAPVFACVPTVTGNFTVTVQVTDSLGRTAVAHATLNMAPVPGSRTPVGGSSSVSLLETPAVLVGTFVGGMVFTLALAFTVERRRRRRREARELVDALSSTTDVSPPDDLGA